MSGIAIVGHGAVSPAGWQSDDLLTAVAHSARIETSSLERPGWEDSLTVRRVPALKPPPPWLRHPRFRRTSPISRFAAAAALEALGDDAESVRDGSLRLGVVMGVMAGCVNYSRRFYQEVLDDPSTASPLIFPETVFNAPASHLAALLEARLVNYTLVGDDTAFVHGLLIAAEWIHEGRVDACLVLGAEECDWLTADAMNLLDPGIILAEGAGAVYLKPASSGVLLANITPPAVYSSRRNRWQCVQGIREALQSAEPADCLFDSLANQPSDRHPESRVWSDWPGTRTSIRRITGNAFNAASAWQVIAAAHLLRAGGPARGYVSIAGANQEAIGLTLAHAPGGR